MARVRLDQEWTDGDGVTHPAGDVVEVDDETLVRLVRDGVAAEEAERWPGPTAAGEGGAEGEGWVGPTAEQPARGWVGPTFTDGDEQQGEEPLR